jgi:hypothetical protein
LLVDRIAISIDVIENEGPFRAMIRAEIILDSVRHDVEMVAIAAQIVGGPDLGGQSTWSMLENISDHGDATLLLQPQGTVTAVECCWDPDRRDARVQQEESIERGIYAGNSIADKVVTEFLGGVDVLGGKGGAFIKICVN